MNNMACFEHQLNIRVVKLLLNSVTNDMSRQVFIT